MKLIRRIVARGSLAGSPDLFEGEDGLVYWDEACMNPLRVVGWKPLERVSTEPISSEDSANRDARDH